MVIFTSDNGGLKPAATDNARFVKARVATIGSVWAANMLMLAIVYWGLRLRGQSGVHFGLDRSLYRWRSAIRVFLQSIAVSFAAIAAFVFAAILMANLLGIPERADMSQYDYLRGNLTLTILALASVYIVSAFAEEVIYRGFLITRISELGADGRAARWLAIVSSSIVFGLVHSDWGLAGMVQASFMGLALGISYVVVQRNLWVTIFAHGYMDTILVLQMYAGNGP
ncbi:CPBP family intramembrane metalloprotease [Stieleria sp. ICT_E10.1]|uniref:CPBP family intramembrane glutamic endopeptidase n=1 Tax=Stieleria sedimenti TaxID=2976331 RepID=UPI00218069C0|nr:CPBP family intramembrane glutamic endopeptidase [Stieleria sedimenti]MCS7466663.1 CPBP family intramembrane metalloprotease [Stieleria sedimenti]